MLALILVGLYLIATLALVIFAKHITIPLASTILIGIGFVLSCILSYIEVLYILAIIGIFALWCFFCYRFKDLDFSGRIYSLTIPRKTKRGRYIGRVLPYYKKQLRYNGAEIVQDSASLARGTLITGASGSGKTYSIINMIKQDISAGRSVAFFNFKGDKDPVDKILKDFPDVKTYQLSWEDVNFSYDPLINLDNAGRVEAILNMRNWAMDGSDSYYKTEIQSLLQKTLAEYEHKEGNFLYEYYQFLNTYSVANEDYKAYTETLKLLELTMTSNFGKMFQSSQNAFNFKCEEQFILLVSFTSATKALGTTVSSLMLRDLLEVGTKRQYSPALALYIDEFGSCESPLIVKDILEKGRSLGIYTTISMQDLNQLIINTNAPFLDSVLGTVSSFIIFPGSTKDMAQKISGTQIYDIDNLLMSLTPPDEETHTPPTAVFISKYPVFGKTGNQVYRFVPCEQKQASTMRFKPSKIKDTTNTLQTQQNTLKTPVNSPCGDLSNSSENSDQNTYSLDPSEWL